MKRVFALPLFLILLAGCGGHGDGRGGVSSSSTSIVGKGKGKATLTVKWPVRPGARLIPNAANSITVTIAQGATVVAKRTIPRPTDGTSTTSTAFTGLVYGAYVVTASAFPNADGTGTAQAAGGGSMTVAEDAPGALAVAMDSTVASLAIATVGTVGVWTSSDVIASAKDASGAVVLLSTGGGAESLTWIASPAGVATVVGTGPTVSVTGAAPGNATLTATLKVKDDGTSLTGTSTIRVFDYRLAIGGYSKTGGDAGNSGMAGGSGASGSVGWSAHVGTTGVGAVIAGPDGTVYAGAGNTVSAVSASGTVLWSTTVAGAVDGLLLTRGGQLLASAGKLTSLNAVDGSMYWAFPADFGATLGSGEALYAPNVLSDGTVVEATSAKTYALDLIAKKVKWSQAFAAVSGAAVMSDDTVVVGNTGEIRGFAGASGAQAFSETKMADVGSLPIPNKANLGKSVSLVRSYSLTAPPCVRGTAATYYEGVYTGTAKVVVGFTSNTYSVVVSGKITYYLRTYSGGSVTSITLGSVVVTINAIPSNTSGGPIALAQDSSARTLQTNIDPNPAAAGSILSTQGWTARELDALGVSVGSDDQVYFADKGLPGLVEAIDPVSGSVRWKATLPSGGTGLPPAIAADGTVYVGMGDGRVVQIR